MNKLFATLFAGAFALTLGTSAFALDTAKATDAVKPAETKAAEPAKAEETKAAEPAKTEATDQDRVASVFFNSVSRSTAYRLGTREPSRLKNS